MQKSYKSLISLPSFTEWLPKHHRSFFTYHYITPPFPPLCCLPLWLWWERFSCTGSTRCWPRRRFWMSWRWIYILYYPGCPSPPSIVWESPGFPLSPCPTGISGSSGDVATVGHSFKKKTKSMQVITDRVTYQTCIKWSASTFADIVKKMSERFIS